MSTPTAPVAHSSPSHPKWLSLKRQLLLWLLLPQLVLWLVGGVLAYRMALNYAEKAIDQSLTQSVRSLARQVKPMGSGLLIDFPRAAQDIIEQDPHDRVSYMVSAPPGQFVLGNGRLPAPQVNLAVQADSPLLYDAVLDQKTVRVALLEVNYGDDVSAPQRLRVQIAKSLAVQERIARELVADMLLPLLLLSMLLGLLVYNGIRRGLQPLARLEAQLGDRSQSQLSALSPIEIKQAPEEVHSLATAVNQLLTAVRRSLSQEKRFINDAAHQLRTPLAGLISQTELAMSEVDTDAPLEAVRQRLHKVHAGATRSAHLVHQLLALARTEADIKHQSLDLAQLAREVAREWTPRAIAAGVDLGYEGQNNVMVSGEKILLREALSNLIDNALQYAVQSSTIRVQPRSVELSHTNESPQANSSPSQGTVITLRVSQDKGQAVLELQDNGPGLSDTDLQKAFDRFWRASERQGGCGLGLSIVKEIALRHGGQVSAANVLPHGLNVRIVLPSTM